MKKTDVILIVTIITLAVSIFLVQRVFLMKAGEYVQVSIDGIVTDTYNLAEDRTVEIEGHAHLNNVLQIKDGKAKMIDAGCKDKLCVHQKEISKTGEAIICLPNRVVVEIIGGKEQEVDAIAN